MRHGRTSQTAEPGNLCCRREHVFSRHHSLQRLTSTSWRGETSAWCTIMLAIVSCASFSPWTCRKEECTSLYTYLHVSLEEHDVLGGRGRTEVDERVLPTSVAGSQHLHRSQPNKQGSACHTRFGSKNKRAKVVYSHVRFTLQQQRNGRTCSDDR